MIETGKRWIGWVIHALVQDAAWSRVIHHSHGCAIILSASHYAVGIEIGGKQSNLIKSLTNWVNQVAGIGGRGLFLLGMVEHGGRTKCRPACYFLQWPVETIVTDLLFKHFAPFTVKLVVEILDMFLLQTDIIHAR